MDRDTEEPAGILSKKIVLQAPMDRDTEEPAGTLIKKIALQAPMDRDTEEPAGISPREKGLCRRRRKLR